ncbi:unnamed protein product, partial [marine sediment metagenome]
VERQDTLSDSRQRFLKSSNSRQEKLTMKGPPEI